MDYPHSRRGDVVETLHGQEIADPYRWLEDPDAPETVDWVERQNAATEGYLSALPERAWFTDTMVGGAAPTSRRGAVLPRWSLRRRPATTATPTRTSGTWPTHWPSSGPGVGCWSTRTGWPPTAGLRCRVSPSPRTAGHAAIGVSTSGSDWQTFRLLDLSSGEDVPDPAITTKFSAAEWLPDGRSFAYLDFGHRGDDGTGTDALTGGRLRVHRIGEPVSDDQRCWSSPRTTRSSLTPR